MATERCFPKSATAEGYMQFGESKSQSPKNRYFALANNFLLGAKSKDSRKLSIAISIEGAQINTDVTNPIRFIVTRRNKQYYFIPPNLVQTKEWIYALRQASKLKITDIYRLCHEIAEDYASKITIIDAQHRGNKSKVIIKAINKKKCNKSSLRQQIPMIKQLKKYQNIIELCDVFETKKYLYLILKLKTNRNNTKITNPESIICDAIHQIVSNAINTNKDEKGVDYWVMGLIAYIMACGHTPSWTDLKTKFEHVDGLFLMQSNSDICITESMQRLITNLLDCHLLRMYTLDEIAAITSSEALFLRGCDNFNSRSDNLRCLFSGFMREIGKEIYDTTPDDVICVCIRFTYNENMWDKVDGKVLKGEKKIDDSLNHWYFETPRQYMRRIWNITVKTEDNGSILKLVNLYIDDLGAICVPVVPMHGDVITILFIRGNENVVRVAYNGKEFEKKKVRDTRIIIRDRKVGNYRQHRYYPLY